MLYRLTPFGALMSFILDIPADDPFEIRLLENKLEILAIVPIGHDLDIGAQYSIHVALIRIEPFEGLYRAELMFSLVEAIGEEMPFIDDGMETKGFLSGDDRRLVLEVCCEVAAGLVAHRQPDEIVMTTLQTNLPDKALVKYEKLSGAIQSSGYDGGGGNTFNGQRIWMFVKS